MTSNAPPNEGIYMSRAGLANPATTLLGNVVAAPERQRCIGRKRNWINARGIETTNIL